ncbi:MAG: PAS domain S-box protein [Cyclobacteriaceae bacterium]
MNKDNRLEKRIFLIICGLACAVNVYGLIGDVSNNHQINIYFDAAGALYFGAVFLYSYYYGLRRTLLYPTVLIILALNMVIWFTLGGVAGAGYFYFSSLIAIVIILPHGYRGLIVSAILLLEAALIYLDSYHPELFTGDMNQSVSRDLWFLSAIVSFIILSLKTNLEREKRVGDKYTASLRQLHRLNLNKGTIDQILDDYLETGVDLFDMQFAIISQIEDDKLKIRNSFGHRSEIIPGSSYDLEKTLSYSIIEAGQTKTFMFRLGDQRHQFSTLKVASFIGTPIFVGERVFGTLNFFSEHPRADSLESYELELIELMARNISHLLSLDENEKQRKETEEALRLSELRFRKIFENATLGITLTRFNGDFVLANEVFLKLTGYSEEELYSMKIDDLLEVKDEHLDKFQRLAFGEVDNYEIIVQGKDKTGKIIDIKLSVSSLRNTEGKPEFVLGLVEDISERLQSERQIKSLNDKLAKQIVRLKETNDELEAFSYSVSHDLRAPLRAIDSFSRILVEDYSSGLDSEANRLLGNITRNSNKMGLLIDDLLAISRISRRKKVTEKVDSKKLISEIIREQSLTYPTTEFVVHVDEDLPEIQGDRTLLWQLFSNLIGNAFKFSSVKENPIIDISFKRRKGLVEFAVKDNGVGFDMKYYDKVFGVFQRLHSQDEFDGTGVGLAIAQRVVIRHGGKIWAESELGVGTTFIISLPAEGKS